MSETALKFGPEWLRALSHGGVSSPPSSPGPVKFKMAEFRYGREEMLALFSKDYSPPEEIHNLGSLCLEEVQEPLAFLPMNAEEQRIWQRCVNSEAVLRGTGRAPINGVGRGRGGSIERGRGRGRGVGAPYYSRGLSYDEETEGRSGLRDGGPPGMNTRGKGYERSQSMSDSRVWNERVPSERGGPPGGIVEDRSGAVSPRKEQNRAANENWRSRATEEEGDRWRALGNSNRIDKWGPRSGWREREGGESEWEERGGPTRGGIRVPRPIWDMERDKNQRRTWEDDHLPEWATEETEEKGGSFDATGAFHAPGSSDESEAINENDKPDAKPSFKKKKAEMRNSRPDEPSDDWPDAKRQDFTKEVFSKSIKEIELHENDLEKDKESVPSIRQSSPLVNGIISEEDEASVSPSPPQPSENKLKSFAASMMPPEEVDKDAQVEEDKLDHMQSVADDLVAKLVEEDEPARPLDKHLSHLHHPPPPGGFLPKPEPLSAAEEQWYYTDPQGDIQGPFTSSDMAAWYKAGYFKPNLLLRRQCDDKFAQLGDLSRVFGRVPFLPGPAVPPLKVSELLNAQKAQAERERFEILQLQNQLYQHQVAVRQQQVYQQLQNLDEWKTLSSGQQQQLYMQYYMALPPLIPPTAPTSLQSQSSSLASSTSTSVGAPPLPTPAGDSRSSLSSSSSAASLLQPQDPIQALVAQMATSKSVPVGTSAESSVPPPMPPPTESTVGGGGSPLQKLLLQLQRGSQGSVGGTTGSLSSSSSTSTYSSHPQGLGANLPPPSSSLSLEKPDQLDPIQSLMNQLSKMQPTPPVNEAVQQQEDLRQREEEQKRIEEERRIFEEQKKAEEERIKQQEMRLQEERQREEEKRKELEEKNQRLEEELRRIQVETRRKQEAAEHQRKEEERKRIQMEQQKAAAEASKKEEEQKRQQRLKQKQEEEMRRKEEAARKQEQERERLEEERRRKEEKRKLEEEKKKQEEERLKREEKERHQKQQLQLQEEMRRAAVEEEKRRMQQLKEEERKKAALEELERREQQKLQQQQQALLQERMKQMAPAWCNPTNEKGSAPSLAEIQKAQEIKERKEREAESLREAQRQKEALKQAAEEKKQMESSNKWSSRSSHSSKKGSSNSTSDSSAPPVKSLVEIQKEEEKELKKRLEKEQAERAAAVSHLSLNAAGVWGSAAQSLSWANRASTGPLSLASQPPPLQQNHQSSGQTWSGLAGNMMWSAVAQTNATTSNSSWSEGSSNITAQSLGGFWESPDTVKASKSAATAGGSSSSRTPPKSSSIQQQANNKATAVTSSSSSTTTTTTSHSVRENNKTNKKKTKDESENVKKLFVENISPSDNFMQWCKSSLHAMKVHASIDIPTFVGFLADVESPYEVHDYIRSYLGDSKEVKEFAKQYLERRSRARHAHKMSHEVDNILAPAPAVNPVSNQEFQEVKTRLKKGSRKKMQKVDSSILGFNVTSNERMNVEGN